MKLVYRGVAYQITQTTVKNSGEVIGKYRGVPWKRSEEITVVQPSLTLLQYRGVTYCKKLTLNQWN